MRTSLLMALCLLLAGCASKPSLTPEQVRELSLTPYPKDAPLGEDLDIVASAKGDQLRLDNRTARRFEGGTLWLNQQYVHANEVIEIGAGSKANRRSLRSFVDRHREHYPVGGLLTPDLGFPLTSAELFVADESGALRRHRLTVYYTGKNP